MEGIEVIKIALHPGYFNGPGQIIDRRSIQHSESPVEIRIAELPLYAVTQVATGVWFKSGGSGSLIWEMTVTITDST